MNVLTDFDISPLLYYKIAGKVRYLLECRNEEDVLHALDFVDTHNLSKTFVCGLGSNVIFTDEYFDGAVIRIVSDESDRSQIHFKDNEVTAFAGERLDKVIVFSFDHSLMGLEWAGGLPGTVGAAIRGNVGAFGGEIKDSVESVYVAVVDNGRVDTRILKHDDLNFSYRSSTVKLVKNMIVLSAAFQLQKTSSEAFKMAVEMYDANKKYRQEHHPLEYPNCGSVFKNIAKQDEVEKILSVYPDIEERVKKDWHGKVSMGYLNRRLGFSGYKVGKAKVSEKHNNFIVNLGGAKAADVKKIIHAIQNKFGDTFGFQPEVEVEIVV